MPCYNEAATVERSARRVLAQPFVAELIIVDDCSSDGTSEVLGSLDDPRVRVLTHERNRGKGAALRTGFAVASSPYVGVHDADLEYDPAEFARLLQPLLRDEADVVYGSRFMTTEARRVLYFWHSLGNKLLTLLSNMATNLNLSDMETCYKVFRREVIEQITIEEDRFGVEPELTAKVAALNVRVFEIGISYHGRAYAEGKKIGWRDGMRAVVVIGRHSLSTRLVARRGRRRPNEFAAADAELAGTLESLDDADNYVAWVADQFRSAIQGRVLEVGAGHGTFSPILAEWSDELIVTDPSARAAEILRECEIGGDNVVVHCAGLEDAVDLGPFDTIVLVNVLEHIEDDEKALDQLRDALVPGGRLCLYVPAFEMLYSRFDLQIGHHRRYTTPDLRRKLRRAGLDEIETYYLNSVGFFAWLLVARVLGRVPTKSRLVSVYDRFAIPVVRAIETRVRPPFGQSVVSVSRRS